MGNFISRVVNYFYGDTIIIYSKELKKPNFIRDNNGLYEIYDDSNLNKNGQTIFII
jgi:hypothetical protein